MAQAVEAYADGDRILTDAEGWWGRQHVLPRSGNPHNQLAVMAFWSGDELKAAYHYARSLCVRAPFTTAHENLLQLLQNNRTRYAALCQDAGKISEAKVVRQMIADTEEAFTAYVISQNPKKKVSKKQLRGEHA